MFGHVWTNKRPSYSGLCVQFSSFLHLTPETGEAESNGSWEPVHPALRQEIGLSANPSDIVLQHHMFKHPEPQKTPADKHSLGTFLHDLNSSQS